MGTYQDPNRYFVIPNLVRCHCHGNTKGLLYYPIIYEGSTHLSKEYASSTHLSKEYEGIIHLSKEYEGNNHLSKEYEDSK